LVAVLALLSTAAAPPAPAPKSARHASVVAAVSAQRDWKMWPAVEKFATSEVIYALGDVHGDYDKLTKLLLGAGLMQGMPASAAEARWGGGKAVLVCTGDMIDKGPMSLEVLQLLRALQASAESGGGGKVIVTLGNHEAEFLASGGNKKKPTDFTTELEAHKIDPVDVALGRDALGVGQWLRTRPIAAKVDDWFFCHAGNTFGMTIPQLETAIETGVDKDGFDATVLSNPNSILQARMGGADNGGVPWFMLDGGKGPGAETEIGLPRLRKYLVALGCEHLVIGHQPSNVNFGGGITRKAGQPFAYKGVLFLIDVGMSRGVQDSPAILLKIHPASAGGKEQAGIVNTTGRESVLWAAP
jgi:hypothetical protein